MAYGGSEIKFSSSLTQAFAAIKHAAEFRGSTQVLILPRPEWVDELEPILEDLIDAECSPRQRDIQLCTWTSWEHSPYSPISSSIRQKISRLQTLSRLGVEGPSRIVICSIESWLQPTAPKGALESLSLLLREEDEIGSRDELRQKLRLGGYIASDLVQEPGQFALRGEILDVFDPALGLPWRIEFFDTQIEKIQFFHPETQRTLKDLGRKSAILLRPAEEAVFPWNAMEDVLGRIKDYCDSRQISRKVRDPIFENIRKGFLPDHYRTWFPFIYEKTGRLVDHLPENARILIFEPEQMRIELDSIRASILSESSRYPDAYWITPDPGLLYPEIGQLLDQVFNKAAAFVRAAPESDTAAPPIAAESAGDGRISAEKVSEWLQEGYRVWIGCRGKSHQERLKFLLRELAETPALHLLPRDPGESLIFPSRKQVILSESLLLGTSAKASKTARAAAHPRFEQNDELELRSPQELSPGDLVVHSIHGVGKYIGLHELRSGDQHMGEYLLIEYSGGDKLYLPVYRLNTIQRHASSAGAAPLDRLGGGQFEKAKQKARESAKKLAVNLIELYAKRALLKGPPFSGRDSTYEEFCDGFEFNETEGQLKAVQDTLDDLESGKLMDRLVCGDVGFGKTEVAIRAAFQAVQSGMQVAVLVPTTLLAFQHEQSFKKRMREFPIRVESISRFKSRKVQNETLKDLREGKIDILVGTHRILSKDVEWARLGLLIVDEEHRFGVDHKEKIKAMQANTHTLTLTATPIPRTLNLALSGLRDISIIKTPPTNRQPIKTYVSNYSPELVKNAIESELSRGGQVFYLYNRVQSIHHRAEEIRKLVPHARILVAHGQMSEAEIESKMVEFYQGHAQILVCTTIIESGIDVPNAGTILIHHADQLGLAQLYQIRGRVGRSHRKAFAYLLVDEDRVLTQEAKMRLDVLQRFVDLGSGFQVASYDLEIRGGGNLLGGEQSGHIAAVGLELFLELLEEAIQELKGNKIDLEERHLEPEIRIPVVCEIGSSIIPDAKVRLSLYRKISMARTEAQVEAMETEFEDRFGKIPPETSNLFWLIRIKNLVKSAGIESLTIIPERTTLGVRKSSPVEIDEVMKLVAGPKGIRDPRVQLIPDAKILFQISFTDLKTHLFELEKLLQRIAPKAFENAKID
jgi:transcription-repair coupling factor (superfamily II helicase)